MDNINLRQFIRDIPNFPKSGVLFRDITPLWRDKTAFRQAIELIAENYIEKCVDVVVGVEARGFIVGAPVAYRLNAGFVPVRKPHKLPYKTISVKYSLEYGQEEVCMHQDSIRRGERVLIVDDLLATGGTAAALIELVSRLGGEILGLAFLVELSELRGRERINQYPIFSLIKL